MQVENFNPEAFGSFNSKEGFLGGYGLNDNGQPLDDEKGVRAEFLLHPVLMGFKSKEAGREIYEDREFVSIMIRGSDKTHVLREATELDKRRFARAYAQFKLGAEQTRVGTPIERLPGVTPSSALMLKQHNIKTIEDMSEVADGFLQNLGTGARELQRQAKEFLSNGKQANAQMQSEMDQLRALLAEQQKQIEALMEVKTAPDKKQK